MNLLITNDDGINSIALHMLVKEMEKNSNVIVVAPDNQRSACGHSITLDKPLIVKEVLIEGIKSKAFSINGTPADCVKIGIDKLSDKKIDAVISGINLGFNLGSDVIYSGTVSAAIEGSIYKVFSAAISMDITDRKEDYLEAVKYAGNIIHTTYTNNIGNDIVLNINIPKLDSGNIKGIKICQLGNRLYRNFYMEKRLDSSEIGYQLKGEIIDNKELDTDVYYIKQGYITVTPLHYDLTNYKIINEVDEIFKGEE